MNHNDIEPVDLISFINEMKDASGGNTTRDFCFVLGAGASITSGIKTRQNLVDEWDTDLLMRNAETYQKWKDDLGINKENKYNFYEEYYEYRFPEPIDGYNYLEKMMENKIPSIGYVMLAYIMTSTRHNLVITTNFDQLLEDAVKDFTNVKPIVISHEGLAFYIIAQSSRPKIIKIPRNLLFEPEKNSEGARKSCDEWWKGLDAVFRAYHPVFIGCSGNNKSLMNFLIFNKEKFDKGHWRKPYWMVYDADKVEGLAREFVRVAQGNLIKHNGFDDVMYNLAFALGYNPSSENYYGNMAERKKEEAKIRYEKAISFLISQECTVKRRFQINEKYQEGYAFLKNCEFDKAYRIGEELYEKGEYDKAYVIGKKLYDNDPNKGIYQSLCGKGLWMKEKIGKKRVERYEEAEVLLRKAIKNDPENYILHKYLGEVLSDLSELLCDDKKREEAIAEKNKAVQLAPEGNDCIKSLVQTSLESGKAAELIKKEDTGDVKSTLEKKLRLEEFLGGGKKEK